MCLGRPVLHPESAQHPGAEARVAPMSCRRFLHGACARHAAFPLALFTGTSQYAAAGPAPEQDTCARGKRDPRWRRGAPTAARHISPQRPGGAPGVGDPAAAAGLRSCPHASAGRTTAPCGMRLCTRGLMRGPCARGTDADARCRFTSEGSAVGARRVAGPPPQRSVCRCHGPSACKEPVGRRVVARGLGDAHPAQAWASAACSGNAASSAASRPSSGHSCTGGARPARPRGAGSRTRRARRGRCRRVRRCVAALRRSLGL